MNLMMNSTKGLNLPNRQDTNNLWCQPSMFVVGQSNNLQKISKYGLPKFDAKSLGGRAPSKKSTTMTGNLNTKGSSSLSLNKVSTYDQNLWQVNPPTVSSRSMICNKRMLTPKQMPMQYDVSPRGFNIFPTQVHPSTPQMQKQKHHNFGNRIMIQQSPKILWQEKVDMATVSPTELTSNGSMMQLSMEKALQDKTGSSISTTALPIRSRIINHKVDPMLQVGMQEGKSGAVSIVTDVNPSSGMSTPLPSYFSPSCYISSPSHGGTPLLLCTPPSCFSSAQINNGFPSVAASVDIPPAFQLNNQNSNISYPSNVSCNINLAPVPTFHESYEGNELKMARRDAESMLAQQAAATYSTPLGKSNNQAWKEETAGEMLEDDEDIWNGSCVYKEWKKDGGSNLFITWTGSNFSLLAKLQKHDLKVRFCLKTNDVQVFNVVFDDHTNARKAFTSQREIHLKMVPPRHSGRSWFRSPSPNFVVKYETRFRLTVRSGKSSSHDIVGELLMSNFSENKGCYIWADQLKGHRIRIVGCQGHFKFPNGTVVKLKTLPRKTGCNFRMGWVSYRCKHTRENFVVRRSGNNLREYIYKS